MSTITAIVTTLLLTSTLFITWGNVYADEEGEAAVDKRSSSPPPPKEEEEIEGRERGSLMRFTFTDGDKYGPKGWTRDIKPTNGLTISIQKLANLEKPDLEINNCKSNWMSPINIHTKYVIVPELGKIAEAPGSESGTFPETLIIAASDQGIQDEVWELAHPTENYNGIEIRSTNMGVMQMMDNFDPIGRTDPFVTYDFHFLTIYYCNLNEAPAHRSMHQIDGRRFPLELHFVFMKTHDGHVDWFEKDNSVPMMAPKNEDNVESLGHSLSQYYQGKYIVVIVVVQGELGKEENRYFQPVVEAAKKFYGKDFDENRLDDTNNVVIRTPWSPSWLFPDSSDYYYYDDASFPVPPCWKVSRYYIMRKRIKISAVQLAALTNIKTAREKNAEYTMACTHSILQHEILTGEVTLNLLEFVLNGDDKKPRSPEETKEWQKNRRKMEAFRQRLKGAAVINDVDSDQNGAITNRIALTLLYLHCIIYCYKNYFFRLQINPSKL